MNKTYDRRTVAAARRERLFRDGKKREGGTDGRWITKVQDGLKICTQVFYRESFRAYFSEAAHAIEQFWKQVPYKA